MDFINFFNKFSKGSLGKSGKSALANEVAIFLERGVSCGVFSTAQAAWRTGLDGVDGEAWSGTAMAEKNDIEIGPDSIFDIASLTKIFTASAALRLVDRGDLALDDRLDLHVPALIGRRLGARSLGRLLAHEAGATWWLPLFETVELAKRGTLEGRRVVLEEALEDDGQSSDTCESVYSDIGYLVLQILLEGVAGETLDRLIAREVTGPLGLESVQYRTVAPVEPPLPGGPPPLGGSGSRGANRYDAVGGIAATERCPWRKRLLTGEVHDDNAWTMGGVAGHAGLFATARDMVRFGAAWLGALDGGRWLGEELACEAIRRRPSGRGLGWDLVSPGGSSTGSRFDLRSFGHLGFTGCSLWIDPERELIVALNTNRVRFGRENDGIREFRPAFHNRLFELLYD